MFKELDIPEIKNLKISKFKKKEVPKIAHTFLSLKETTYPLQDRMPTYDKEELKHHVKGWINDIRQQHGAQPLEELPKGQKGNPAGCIVARALQDIDKMTVVGGSKYKFKGGKQPLPQLVSMFVNSFDMGAFPELQEPDMTAQEKMEVEFALFKAQHEAMAKKVQAQMSMTLSLSKEEMDKLIYGTVAPKLEDKVLQPA